MSAESEEDWEIMGIECTFSGPLQRVVYGRRPPYVRSQMLAKGAPLFVVNSLVPCCPTCGGVVGKFPAKEHAELISMVARLAGYEPAELNELLEWAKKQTRCYPLVSRHLARAYQASLRREARNRKRAGKLQ